MHKLLIAAAALMLAVPVSNGLNAADSSPDYNFELNPDGSLDVAAFKLPFSAYASPEARLDMEQKFERLREMRKPETIKAIAEAPNRVQFLRDLNDRVLFAPLLMAQRRAYAVNMTSGRIGGVDVQTFVPKDGVAAAHKHHILINLHGGAFMVGWPLVSQIESIPIAAVGRIKVVSVNYGQYPEARFPQASKDVAAVYRELLKSYKPSQIGMYGCSAGGMLTSEVMVWLQKEALPLPAAVALLSSAIDPNFIGDSAYITPNLGSYIKAPQNGRYVFPYFEGKDMNDLLISPSGHPDALSKFPPTLLATGTRSTDLSSAAQSNLDLLKAGVNSQLVICDGLDHCFMYNPDMPESREAYALVARFFARNLSD